jgi:hypothetical protein
LFTDRSQALKSGKGKIMTKPFQTLALAALVLCLGCQSKKTASCPIDKNSSGKACRMQSAGTPAAADGFSGIVKENITTAGYTYVLVDTGGAAAVWAVAPDVAAKPGDTVTVSGVMPMQNYKSKTLNRTFDLVYFAGSITRKGVQTINPAQGNPHGMNAAGSAVPMARMDFSGIKKPLQGKTVADIFAEKDTLAGKNVTIAAKVVKVTYGILGKNWMHVQDGTGAAGTNDLTVTTDAESKLGQTVLVSGLLSKDKDIGAGYKYSVIIENAEVTLEK